jgi:mannose-1-phosphate guanylyltransferase
MEDGTLDLVVVIMAGGIGTRFWPLSTDRKPKQFLKLFEARSLLQKSFDRGYFVPPERILVLTNVDFVGLVREQLPDIPEQNVVGEPFRRDTAAAVCLGALLCQKRFGNPVIITLTADHLIEPVEVFRRTVLSAARLVRESGALYTLGIQPTYPATGYGYLEVGPQVADDRGIEHYQVLSFKEKPDLPTAEFYLQSGNFYWNSGMFVWTADAVLKEMEAHLPHHMESLSEAVTYDGTPEWPAALSKGFESLAAISVDFGVMEKAKKVRCVAARFSWTDVGGWLALRDYLPRDEDGNSLRGQVLILDAKENIIFCEDPEETVMLVGVDDLVIVRSGKKTLLVHKDRTEEIKKLLQ